MSAKAEGCDYQTVFTNAKAGMEGVDKAYVQRVVYEMSKGSAHFKNEQRKNAETEARIARLKEQLSKLNAAELAHHTKAMDAQVAVLEASRDVSRVWIHVDMDAFFCSCEELANPALKDVPMAVGGIGMISTANYHARKFGVRSAMPGFIGRRLCPQLVFVHPNFERYQACSEATRNVFRRYDPHFEAGSLDEAYLDVTDFCRHNRVSGAQVAARIRHSVQSEVGVTCSCGIAVNKMLAKICSDIRKPNDQFCLVDAAADTALPSPPFDSIPGTPTSEAFPPVPVPASPHQLNAPSMAERAASSAAPPTAPVPASVVPTTAVPTTAVPAPHPLTPSKAAAPPVAAAPHHLNAPSMAECAAASPAAAANSLRVAQQLAQHAAQAPPATPARTLPAHPSEGPHSATPTPTPTHHEGDSWDVQPPHTTAHSWAAQPPHPSTTTTHCWDVQPPPPTTATTHSYTAQPPHTSSTATHCCEDSNWSAEFCGGDEDGGGDGEQKDGSRGGGCSQLCGATCDGLGGGGVGGGGGGGGGDGSRGGGCSQLCGAICDGLGGGGGGGQCEGSEPEEEGAEEARAEARVRRRATIVAFVDTLPVRKVPGIGRVTESLLSGVLGVKTCGDLLAARGYVAALFSQIQAQFFLERALGLGTTHHDHCMLGGAEGQVGDGTDSSSVNRKGISCERTFAPISGRKEQAAMAASLVETLCADMETEGIEGCCVSVKLKATDFRVTTHAKTLSQHLRTPEAILPVVLSLLKDKQSCCHHLELRLMGVRMSGLRKAGVRKIAEGAQNPLTRMLLQQQQQQQRQHGAEKHQQQQLHDHQPQQQLHHYQHTQQQQHYHHHQQHHHHHHHQQQQQQQQTLTLGPLDVSYLSHPYNTPQHQHAHPQCHPHYLQLHYWQQQLLQHEQELQYHPHQQQQQYNNYYHHHHHHHHHQQQQQQQQHYQQQQQGWEPQHERQESAVGRLSVQPRQPPQPPVVLPTSDSQHLSSQNCLPPDKAVPVACDPDAVQGKEDAHLGHPSQQHHQQQHHRYQHHHHHQQQQQHHHHHHHHHHQQQQQQGAHAHSGGANITKAGSESHTTTAQQHGKPKPVAPSSRGRWACAACTYAGNAPQMLRCEVCDTRRGYSAPHAPPLAASSALGKRSHEQQPHQPPSKYHRQQPREQQAQQQKQKPQKHQSSGRQKQQATLSSLLMRSGCK